MSKKLNTLKIFLKTVETLQPFREAEKLLKFLQQFENTSQMDWKAWFEVQTFFNAFDPIYEIKDLVDKKKHNTIYISSDECIQESVDWRIANTVIDVYNRNIGVPGVWIAKYLEKQYTQYFGVGNSMEVTEHWKFGVKNQFESHFPENHWGIHIDREIRSWHEITSQVTGSKYCSTGLSEYYLVDFDILAEFLCCKVSHLQKARHEGMKKGGKQESYFKLLEAIKSAPGKVKVRNGWIILKEESSQLDLLKIILEKREITPPNVVYSR